MRVPSTRSIRIATIDLFDANYLNGTLTGHGGEAVEESR
jgi:hypothetical protein